MSLPLQFDKQNGLKVLKVFGWTVASAAVTLLINLIPTIHTDNSVVLLVETILSNNVLVALQQWITAQEAEEVSQTPVVPPQA